MPLRAENDVVVIGGGQAGLAVSHQLTTAGVEHVVLERDRIGGSWAGRWDSFRLVTPNHTIRLPGGEYEGDEPHGFLARDEIVRHLERYAASFSAPVQTGVDVLTVSRSGPDGWRLATPTGSFSARTVVVATGAFQRAHEPAAIPDLRRWLPVLPASEYRSPSGVPDGPVLVVGSGQTGTQIAEELTLAGRRVILSCGRAPWMDRRIDERDMVDWLLDTGLFEQTRADLARPDAVFVANLQASGANGGHDLHYRTLAAMGVQLAGRLVAADDGVARFADDLAASVTFGDAVRAELCQAIRISCEARGRPVPSMPNPPPFDVPGLPSVPVRELGSVVVATGYRPAYSETILHREAFDTLGFPLQQDGASTVLPRLFFVGVHFLRKRKSSLFLGVGEDAAVVARQVVDLSA